MTVVKWSEWYEVGIPSLDLRHWNLFNAMNRLHEAIHSEGGEKQIPLALDALFGDILTHLREEETLMVAVDHPGASECRTEHHQFLEQVASYRSQYKRDPTRARATELSTALVDWLMIHMTKMDIQFVNAVKGKVEDRWAEVWCCQAVSA